MQSSSQPPQPSNSSSEPKASDGLWGWLSSLTGVSGGGGSHCVGGRAAPLAQLMDSAGDAFLEVRVPTFIIPVQLLPTPIARHPLSLDPATLPSPPSPPPLAPCTRVPRPMYRRPP